MKNTRTKYTVGKAPEKPGFYAVFRNGESQRAWQKVGEVNLFIAQEKRKDQNAELLCWLGMPHDRAAWHREGVASGRLKELRKMRKMLIRVALCAEADELRKRTAALKVGDVVTVRARVVRKEEGRVIFKKEEEGGADQ